MGPTNDGDDSPAAAPGPSREPGQAPSASNTPEGAFGRKGPRGDTSSSSIRQQAERALRLPPRDRLDFLLSSSTPMRLVRALPDAEFYMAVREVGPADSQPLLALASASQLTHLFDLETWRGDRFDAERSGGWLAVLLDAGEPALERWLRSADDDALTLVMQRWLRTAPIEAPEMDDPHGRGETEWGDERGLMSPDGNYRLRPVIAEHAPAAHRLLQIFYVKFPERYAQTMWQAVWELPAELEEAALRWRQSRMEEHGYPPRDEALSVYAAPTGTRARPEPPVPSDPGALPVSRLPVRVLPQDGVFAQALSRMSASRHERLLHEAISLGNWLLVADGADTGDPAAHRHALRRALGYVTVALEMREPGDPDETCLLLDSVPLLELFREGYAQAGELQRLAHALRERGWAAAHPEALRLVDEPLLGRLRGLFEPRPLYLELRNDEAPTLRGFESLTEIEQTRLAVDTVRAVGVFLVNSLGLDVARALTSARVPRFSTLVMTLLAWHAMRDELRGDPLPPEVVADFLRTVASRRTAAPEATERAVEALGRRLATTDGLSVRDAALVTAFAGGCLPGLRDECASLDPGVPVLPGRLSSLLVAD